MEWQATYASPQVGLRSVARIRIVVVLPAPLGPMNPNRSPRFKFKLIDLMANNSPYFFVKSRVSIIEKQSKFSVGSNAEFFRTMLSVVLSVSPALRYFPTLNRQHKPIYYRGLILLVSDRRVRGI